MSKKYSYSELHNKAVLTYQKMIMSFLFIGIFNVLGAIIGSFKGDGYFPSMLSNIVLFNLIGNVITSKILLTFVNVLISIAFAIIFIIIWHYAKKANIKAIIIGLIIYVIETTLLFIFDVNDSYLIPQILLHLLFIIFITIGILSYYHVFAIERKFKK